MKKESDWDLSAPRICTKCKVEQPASGFSTIKSKKDGFRIRSWCKICMRKDSRERYRDPKRAELNSEINRVNNKKYRTQMRSTQTPQAAFNRKGSMSVENPNHYLNNAKLTGEMIVSHAQGRLTRDATNMLIQMVKKISTRFTYKDADDRKDCEQEAMYQCFSNWHNFDPDITQNAFAYFTEVIKRGFAKSWKVVNLGRSISLSIERHGSEGDKRMNI